MTLSRRTALTGLMSAGVAATTAGCGRSDNSATPTGQSSSASVSNSSSTSHSAPLTRAIPHEINGLLLNQERAMAQMQSMGIDLLISGTAKNIYYLTNQQPVTFSLGLSGLDFATLSAHGDARPSLISSQIGYYFTAPEKPQTDLIDLKFYSGPADPEAFNKIVNVHELINAPAGPGLLPRVHADFNLTPSEARRRSLTDLEAAEMKATISSAILQELYSNPLPNKTIAIDDERLRPIIEKSELDLKIVDGESLIRHIRIQKTPMELELARYAIEANAAASLIAAKSARAGATFQEIRGEFSKACGAYATIPEYMMIDTLVPHFSNGEIKEGRSFLIDCVSKFEGYHGDYGRTVCVGEPTRKINSVLDTLSVTWDRLRSELRPGLTYNDLYARSAELFKESDSDVTFYINPHTIGLHHSDDPIGGEYGSYQKENLTLQENMILSIDMPVLDNGLGGSAHLEDLVLITKDGAELLNESTERFIVV